MWTNKQWMSFLLSKSIDAPDFLESDEQDEKEGIEEYKKQLRYYERKGDKKNADRIRKILAQEKQHAQTVDKMEKSTKSSCDRYKNSDGTFKGGFGGAVKYFMCQGHSKDSATKIAGKIAAEKAGIAKSIKVMFSIDD